VDVEAVITAKDVECIYEVPLVFHKEGLDQRIVEQLHIWTRNPHLDNWEELVSRLNNPEYQVNIAIVGKYVDLTESYKSLNEALAHAGIPSRARVNLLFIDSETITSETCDRIMSKADGILVPGGFGSRGVEGKILAARFARENKIPYFGICLGMQIAVIEFARNLVGLKDANSSEFDKRTAHPVIYLMMEWYDEKTQTIQNRDVNSDKGGTMRLGAYPCHLEKNTLAFAAYAKENISERHRHRYEFNNEYLELFQEKGLIISGMSPGKDLVEIIELADHPWFLGCQFHPEFKSRPMKPQPLFKDFIKASLENSNWRKY